MKGLFEQNFRSNIKILGDKRPALLRVVLDEDNFWFVTEKARNGEYLPCHRFIRKKYVFVQQIQAKGDSREGEAYVYAPDAGGSDEGEIMSMRGCTYQMRRPL